MTFNLSEDYDSIQNTYMEQASEEKATRSSEKKHFKPQENTEENNPTLVSGTEKQQPQVDLKALSEEKKKMLAKRRKARRKVEKQEDEALINAYVEAQQEPERTAGI